MNNRIYGLKYFSLNDNYKLIVHKKYRKLFQGSDYPSDKIFYNDSLSNLDFLIGNYEDNILLIKNIFSKLDKNLERKIISAGYNRQNIVSIFPSLYNPRWIFPLTQFNIVKKSGIIKPTKFKSKLIFSLSKFFYWINPFLFKLIFPFQLVIFSKDKNFENNSLLKKYLDFDFFSIYTGAPGPFQKYTFQFIKNGVVNAYAKLSYTKENKARLKNEYNILNILNKYNFNSFNFPIPITLSNINDDLIFFQSAYSGNVSKVYKYFNEIHLLILTELFNKTKKTISKDDFIKKLRKEISLVKTFFDLSSESIYSIFFLEIEKLLIILEQKLSPKLYIGISHGDFSPWNMFINNKEVFLFDWELGEYRLPLWDLFNFIFHSHFHFEQIEKTKLLNILLTEDNKYREAINKYCEIVKIDVNLMNVYLSIFIIQLLLFYLNYRFFEIKYKYPFDENITKMINILLYFLEEMQNFL